jgi:hypothetical protein
MSFRRRIETTSNSYPIFTERMLIDPPQTLSAKNEMGSFSSFNASAYNNGT